MAISEKAVRRSYLEALAALREKPAAVLIIEDEVFIALDLQQIVRNLGLSIAGIAKNRTEALRVGLAKPKLILADYKLRDDRRRSREGDPAADGHERNLRHVASGGRRRRARMR